MHRRLAALALVAAACAACVLVVSAAADPTTGGISGVVTNSSAADIAGTSVTVYQDAVVAGSAITAADGTYTVSSLAAGSYTVSFTPPPPPSRGAADDENYLPQKYDGESATSGGDPVVVSAGQTTSDIDASLQPGGTISGVVLDESGKPIEAVGVTAFDANGVALPGAQSLADGSWSIDRLPPGVYTVGFSTAGLNFLLQFFGAVSTIAGAYGVSVSVGATSSVGVIHLQPGGQLTGTVTDASSVPITNAVVDAYNSSGEVAASTTTAADGTFSVNGLASGSYRVGFAAPPSSLSAGANYLPEFFSGASTLSSATAVSVSAGSATAGINAKLAAGGEIQGTVTDATSDAVSNLSVTAYNSAGAAVGTTTTASDGSYAIDALASGAYRIGFGGPALSGPAPNYAPQFYGGDSLADAKAVSITAGAAASVVNAELTNGGTVSGTITDAFGAPLGGVSAEAFDASGNLVGNGATSADGTGDYTITALPSGSYRIGFDTGCCADYVTQYSGNEPTLASAQLVPVTPGGATGGVDAAMVAGGDIAGTVTDADGDPLPGVTVEAIASNGVAVTSTGTAADGSYALVGLTSGNYSVEFEGFAGSLQIEPEFYGSSATLAGATAVQVSAGAPTAGIDGQVVLVSGSLAGTVTDGSADPLAGVQVTVYGLDGQVVGSGALSGAGGGYEVAGLAPGFYRVGFALSGYTSQFYPDADSLSDGQSVYVPAAQTASALDAQLPAIAPAATTQPPQQQLPPPSQTPEQAQTGGSGGGTATPVAVVASVGSARVSGSTVSTTVTCSGVATASCAITLTLTSVETSKGSKLIAVSAAKKPKTARRTVTVARTTVTLAGGQSETVHVKLNGAGERLLSSLHKLPVKLVCATGTTQLSSQELTLKAPARKPKKH
jgi:hypothetical protein